jgi:divalent metal cation (Fe/Co/Zn/Cd) transporter
VSQTTLNPVHTQTTRAEDARHGRRLEYFTIGWNCTEAVVGILAGVAAGSIALIGFAIDSLIETFSGLTLLWRLQQHDRDEYRERIARKLVGGSLLLLALYVAVDSVKSILAHEAPHESIVGIALAGVSLIVMPLLARAKRRVAARLESGALHADSRQTDICAFLSAILLLGLGLNALFGWWWADPVAALIMVPIVAHEGIEAFRGRHCGDCKLEV